MKKILAISSVLLGVVFLAGCGQQPVSQTQPTTPAPVAPIIQPTETASWKIYQNTKQGFELKYPKDWSISDQTDSYVNFQKGLADFGISIISDNLNSRDLLQWYNDYYSKKTAEAESNNWPLNLSSPDKFKKASFNKLTAIEGNNLFAFDHSVTEVYFSKDNNIFLVSYPDSDANNPNFSEDYAVIKQILSTFKFTK